MEIEWLKSIQWFQVLLAVVLFAAGYLLAKLASVAVEKVVLKKFNKHTAVLARRAVYYAVLLLFLITALQQLGAKLGVLLGAAGVFSVAIGFASQTSISNLISGLFVLIENTFEVGDAIRVGPTTGEVLAIDLLSVKLRTFDNLYVRIPNETLIKSEVTNLTKFPIRRVDLKFIVDQHADCLLLEKQFLAIADQYVKSLEEPEPQFVMERVSEIGTHIQFSFWVKKENLSLATNAMTIRLQKHLLETNALISKSVAAVSPQTPAAR